ncbi:unnamed protein product [Caenorhabditis bovis]|uniref:MICOS complex subunit n=1 Tax=Caenorhabditis bovis TaxID=2654633 RepID=A0A8S1EP54_9PELO|nr:unnamed protein product [Caenorhabditis bovis]
MVDKKTDEKKRARSPSSSSSSSSGSSSSGSSSSGSRSSSSSSSSRSRSPRRRERRMSGGRRSRSRSNRRSPARARARRSPSPMRRRRSPSPRRRDRSGSRGRRRSPRRSPQTRSPRRVSANRSPRRSPLRKRSLTPAKRICIRNLSKNVQKGHLEEIFAIYGSIKLVDLPPDRNHQYLHRGYGYIEYENVEDAEKAIKYMDGGQIDGLIVSVEMILNRASASGARRSPIRRRSPARKSPVRRGSPSRRRNSPLRGMDGGDKPIVKSIQDTGDKVTNAVSQFWNLITSNPSIRIERDAKHVSVSKLPLYAEDKTGEKVKFVPDEPLPLQREFATLRIACEREYERIVERFKVVDSAVNQTKNAISKTNAYLTEEWTALPKAAAITVGGMAGFMLGLKRGVLGRTFTTSVGLATMAAFCYPVEAVDVIKVGVAHTEQAWQNFQDSPPPAAEKSPKHLLPSK